MSNMVFLASVLLSWSEIARILELRERTRGIGDGKIDGYNYTVAQQGDKIYVILPDYPRERCKEIVQRLLQRLRPDADIQIGVLGYASNHCNYCLTSVSFAYRCHRCGGWYCNEHRLPERHNCPGEPKRAAAEHIGPKEKEPKECAKKKVVVMQVPCA